MKKLEIKETMCAITKKVIQDYNSMSNIEFFRKYQCSKLKYYKRVKLWSDPYMNAPLAIIGKWLAKHM